MKRTLAFLLLLAFCLPHLGGAADPCHSSSEEQSHAAHHHHAELGDDFQKVTSLSLDHTLDLDSNDGQAPLASSCSSIHVSCCHLQVFWGRLAPAATSPEVPSILAHGSLPIFKSAPDREGPFQPPRV